MKGNGRVDRAGFRVLIATDGSPSSRAAVVTARAFPWPRVTRVRGVVVSPTDWIGSQSPAVRRAFTQTFERLADTARQAIARRWPEAEVVNIDARPADGILSEARRFRADVIVVGWRGHGAFRRLLIGSVSRDVVERAPGPVLVIRRAVREIRRIVIGIDGSPNLVALWIWLHVFRTTGATSWLSVLSSLEHFKRLDVCPRPCERLF